MRIRYSGLICLLLLAGCNKLSSSGPCAQNLYQGQAPQVQANIAKGATEICYGSYASLQSSLTKTGIWSAEHLTRDSVEAAHRLQRPEGEVFHPDSHLSPGQRAELVDYSRSGYDRGHLSPSGDMPTAETQLETFSLGNMAPQFPSFNRGLWEHIEAAVRREAEVRQSLYVVTGVIFYGKQVSQIGPDHVLVPTHYFKAVLDPVTGVAGAYIANNDGTDRCKIVSLEELQHWSGIDAFPGVPAAVKTHPALLNTPRSCL